MTEGDANALPQRPEQPTTYAVRFSVQANRDAIDAAVRLADITEDEGLGRQWYAGLWETEARLLAAAQARGKTPDEIVAALLDRLPAQATEAELLKDITEGLPESFWRRYRELTARRRAETLTQSEQEELIALSDQVEERTLRRTQALVKLAQRRGVELTQLLRQMGIRPVPVGT